MNNKYEVRGDVTAIFLNKADGTVLETLISTSHLEKANEHSGSWYAKWTPSSNSYYVMGDFYQNNKRRRVMVHRHIMDAPQTLHVDHINHDTLDNRKENLRLVTVMENHQNRNRPRIDSKSGVQNVMWSKDKQKWGAEIRVNKKKIFLGRYDDINEAADVVKKARALLMPYSQEALTGLDVKEFLKPHLNKALRSKKNGKSRNVYWNNVQNRWQVRIKIDGKERSFGYYDTEEEASKVAARNRAELLPGRTLK